MTKTRDAGPGDINPGDIDHSPDEALAPGEPISDAADPSINQPPEPVEVNDPKLAHVHSVASEIVALIERIAALVPAGHSLAVPISNIKLSLETLWAMAHDPK